jgi:hypothetical protein
VIDPVFVPDKLLLEPLQTHETEGGDGGAMKERRRSKGAASTLQRSRGEARATRCVAAVWLRSRSDLFRLKLDLTIEDDLHGGSLMSMSPPLSGVCGGTARTIPT